MIPYPGADVDWAPAGSAAPVSRRTPSRASQAGSGQSASRSSVPPLWWGPTNMRTKATKAATPTTPMHSETAACHLSVPPRREAQEEDAHVAAEDAERP